MEEKKIKSEERNSNRIMLAIIFSAILIIATTTFVYAWKFHGTSSSGNPEAWGQFGDYLGGTLNPALSFLALIAVLLTFRLQSIELRNSTIEMTKSSEALQEQVKSQRKQNFENTFFSLIRLHQDIIQSTQSANHYGNAVHGRESFRSLFQIFRAIYERKFHAGKNVLENINVENIQSSWDEFIIDHQHIVGHYFRNIYTIVKFIDDSEIEEKYTYIKILRAQLSSPELALLFFNCLHSAGSKKFKPLVEQYGLLENMDTRMIPNFAQHKYFFKSSAYSLDD